jgi:6,7-dimethyl-8-ribityllumazine synthase
MDENPTARPRSDGVRGTHPDRGIDATTPTSPTPSFPAPRREITRNGATSERVVVPGAFEIPGAIALAADRYDGFVALGCVIRGETTHYDYVCGESARGLMDLTVHKKMAIGYGIVTVNNVDQAWARAATDRGDKGGDAAHACLAMVALGRRWRNT